MAPRSGNGTASVTRHVTRGQRSKAISAIQALAAAFHILRGSGDSRGQTGRSRGACEQHASLWEESLPLSPGQLGSSQSLNGNRAGDYFSLAVWTPPWTAG